MRIPPSLNILSAVLMRELRAMFTSPVGTVVLALFLVLAGFFHAALLFTYREASMEGTFQNMTVLLLFLTPIITMRLFAEEKKLGTLELILTRPVRDTSFVLGKFFAAVAYLLILLIPTAVFAAVLFRYGNPDLYPLLSGYLGVLLIGIAFLALGTFASVLTENQIIAVVLSFAFLLLFWAIDALAGTVSGASSSVISYLSLRTHLDDLLRGVIDVKDILFYLSFTTFWLFCTVKVLEVRKWK